MGKETIDAVVSIVTAIIGLAILAVLVSNNADTARVIHASSAGLAEDIKAAVSPVSGMGFGMMGPSIGNSYAAY